jgi:V/A-type H+-transporting ATPase subunit E
MTGLSKITDKILDEARAEAAARLAEADAECARINAEYKEKTDKTVNALNATARSEAEDIVSRTRSGEAAMRKNALLKTQGEMIDRAFEIAEKELAELGADERVELMTGLLTAVISAEWEAEQSRDDIYGDTDEGERIYEVMLNPKDRANHGKTVINNFKRRIVGKDMGDIASRVVLSDNTADIEGGIVVKIGSVEINSSVHTLVAGLRSSYEAKVAKILFS